MYEGIYLIFMHSLCIFGDNITLNQEMLCLQKYMISQYM